MVTDRVLQFGTCNASAFVSMAISYSSHLAHDFEARVRATLRSFRDGRLAHVRSKACDELQRRTALERLEACGTVRLALCAAIVTVVAGIAFTGSSDRAAAAETTMDRFGS